MGTIAAHERHQRVGRVGAREHEQLPAGTVHDLADGADDRAVRQLGAQALQLVDVELVRVVRRRRARRRRSAAGCRAAPRRRRGRATSDEPDQQPTRVRSRRLDGEHAVRPAGPPRGQHRAGSEPLVRASRCAPSTTSSPRRPCARTTTPTRTSPSIPARSAIGVDDIDPHAAATDATHDRAQRGGRAAAAADHLAEVLRVHPDLEGASAAGGDQLDLHVVRVVDDPPDQVLEGVREDASRRGGGLGGPAVTVAGSSVVPPAAAAFGRRSASACAGWWPRWWAPRPPPPAPPGTGPACRPSPAAA